MSDLFTPQVRQHKKITPPAPSHDQFQSHVPASTLGNATPSWTGLDGNNQLFVVRPAVVAEPGMLALAGLALGLSGWVSARRRREAAAQSR